VPAKAEEVDVAVMASPIAASVMIRSQGLRPDRTLAPEAAEEPGGPVSVIAG